MPLKPMPATNPVYKTPWVETADTLLNNVRELVTAVPELANGQEAAKARISSIESALAPLTAQVGGLTTSVGTVTSQTLAAVASAGQAKTAAETASSAASAAAAKAEAAAGQVTGLGSRVAANETAVTDLSARKADTSTLAAVATTGRYADLVGAPGVSVVSTTSTTRRPTADPSVVVAWHTPIAGGPPTSLMVGGDYWVPTP